MRVSIFILALALLLCIGADAKYSPALEMATSANITGSSNSYVNNMKLGGSQLYKTVGPYEWCDYKTDGVDDATQILQAFRNGAKVVALAGTIYVDPGKPAYFTDNCQALTGLAGWYSPTMKLRATAAGAVFVLNQSGCELSNILIEGNRSAAQTGSYGIDWSSGNQNTIQDVKIQSTGDIGLYAHYSGSSGGSTVTKMYVWKSYSHGVYITTHDIRFTNNEVGSCYSNQIYITGSNNQIIGNHFWSDPTFNLYATTMWVEGVGNIITDNVFDTCQWGAIDLEAAAHLNIVNNNKFWDCRQSGGSFIIVKSDRNVINSNVCYDSTGPNVTNAILLNSGGDYNKVVGNELYGDAVSNSGTGNQIAYNS